jgi:sugar (pentulose or hexulose) kinase
MGRPFIRPSVTEAGTLGAAIIAGVGHGLFPSFEAGVESMVRLERTFDPNPRQQQLYADRYEKYTRLWPLMSDYLRGLNRGL